MLAFSVGGMSVEPGPDDDPCASASALMMRIARSAIANRAEVMFVSIRQRAADS